MLNMEQHPIIIVNQKFLIVLGKIWSVEGQEKRIFPLSKFAIFKADMEWKSLLKSRERMVQQHQSGHSLRHCCHRRKGRERIRI